MTPFVYDYKYALLQKVDYDLSLNFVELENRKTERKIVRKGAIERERNQEKET